MAWACLSVAWSISPALTARRFFVLAMLSVGALAVASRFSAREVCRFAFASLGGSIVLALSCEIVLGTFHPVKPEYRFAGIMHPNDQGMGCALFLLVSIALSRSPGRRRWFYLAAAVAAGTVLVLTKSPWGTRRRWGWAPGLRGCCNVATAQDRVRSGGCLHGLRSLSGRR